MTRPADSRQAGLHPVFRRINEAATISAKARALLAAIDWGASIRPEPSRSAAEHERDRHIFAVTAVAEFLNAVGRADLWRQFRELASGLSDLDPSGITRPFLVAKSPATRADGSNTWRTRAHVAVAVDALLRAGLKRKEIAEKIRVEYPELAALVQSGKDLGVSALSWRDQFHKGTQKNFEAVAVYQGYLQFDPVNMPAAALRIIAEQFLKQAAADARAIAA
jgi:hypothetical protein